MSLRDLLGLNFMDGTKLCGEVDWLEERDGGQETGGMTWGNGFKLERQI